jgi:hypothetical protein
MYHRVRRASVLNRELCWCATGAHPSGEGARRLHLREVLSQADAPSARDTLRVALESIYVGEIRHRNLCHPGQHQAILDRAVRDRTQQQLREHRVRNKSRDASVEKNLTGRLFDENGDRLTPRHARKGERKYRYYVSRNFLAQRSTPSRGGWRLPARELEDRVAAPVREMLDDQGASPHTRAILAC